MVELTDAEIEAANERGHAYRETHPHAAAARYDAKSARIIVDLTNGACLRVPAASGSGAGGRDARAAGGGGGAGRGRRAALGDARRRLLRFGSGQRRVRHREVDGGAGRAHGLARQGSGGAGERG